MMPQQSIGVHLTSKGCPVPSMHVTRSNLSTTLSIDYALAGMQSEVSSIDPAATEGCWVLACVSRRAE